jgi:hypothetical protein
LVIVVRLEEMTRPREVKQPMTDHLNSLTKLLTPSVTECYSLVKQRIQNAREIFDRIAAEQLAPHINTQAMSMPRKTYSEKVEAARWIRQELSDIGLAIQCPKTGEATMIQTDPRYESGIFRLRKFPNSTGHRAFTTSGAELFHLTLCPRPKQSETGEGKWSGRAASETTRLETER